MIIMLLSLLVVVVISTIKFGGIESIWNTALNGNRIIFLKYVHIASLITNRLKIIY